MADRRIVVQITGDSRQLERAFSRSARSAQGFQAQMAGVSKSLKTGLAAGGFAIAGSVVFDQLRKSVSAASDLNEQMAKSQQVFGDASESVIDWSRTTADSMGISQRAALAATGTFGNLFATVGLGPAAASEMSRALVQLTADLASFNNASPEEVLLAIRSGLVGEAEPLRRYGVLLSETRVQQEALVETGKKSVAALTDQEKALARYNIILTDTAPAQGDFERTQAGLANQSRILDANLQDLSANIGGVLVPSLTAATGAANLFFDAMGKSIGGVSAGDVFGWASGWNELNFLIEKARGNTEGLVDEVKSLRPEDIGGARGPGAIAAANAAAAAVEAARDLTRSRKSFGALVKGLGLKADKARLTESLADDILVTDELIRAIERQIKAEGKTFDLVSDLTQARLTKQGLVQAQAAAASAASATAAADAERRAREAEERARKALEARKTARLGRQFTALGLTVEGQQRVPGAGSLRNRLAGLRRQVEGTVLDTPKTAAQLERISSVLSGKFGKVGRDVRSAILDMFKDITGALKDGSKTTENATVSAFQKRGVGKILAGLGLSPTEIKALRQRLAQGGVGGFAPRKGLGGAFGMGVGAGGNVIVNGNLIVQNPRDVDSFVKEVQRRGHRSSGSRRGTRPGVNRGLS